MLPQQMGPASHRRSRQGGSQNDRSENRRSNGVCVVPAEDVRPGGHGPAGISVAWHPTIHAARCRGPGEACSWLQAAKGSCHEAHAAAGPQHRARASATRLETADRVGRHPLGFHPASRSTAISSRSRPVSTLSGRAEVMSYSSLLLQTVRARYRAARPGSADEAGARACHAGRRAR